MKRNLLLCLSLVFLAIGCARRESDDAIGTSANGAEHEPPQAPASAPAPPRPELAAVEVEVSLSPDAERALRGAGEGIRVEVIYGGDPAPGSTIEPNEFGLVELAKSVHELDGAGTLHFSKDDLDHSRLDQITGQPQLMINAMSTLRSSSRNMLACSFYWDTLSAAGRDGVKIPCTLIQPD